MKDPIKVLFEEHEIIGFAIAVSREADKLLEVNETEYEKIVRNLIVFFRSFADRYHHAKEENILFPAMNGKNELLQDGVIGEMLENHRDFRDMIAGIETALDRKDLLQARRQLRLYTEALSDHIAVENDEVFQIAGTVLDGSELERIYFSFEDCDRELGDENKKKLVDQLIDTRIALANSH